MSSAIENLAFEFDFIFCDEAHKTAGVGMNKFSLVHDNRKIPSKRRLYATATPRIVKESLKKKLNDDLKYAYDMNDPETFGYEFYRMSFKDAIEEGILVDYKIIAVGVNSDELKEYIENKRYVDSTLSIDELANNYALEHVMNKYNAKHALTFHSRVKLANEFAKRHSQLYKDVDAYSVNGEQSTSYRNKVLNEFRYSTKAIVSNARCLTEGVDVPTIDLVYFCDPKNSKVDIVQAVGRALRRKDGKKVGLVVVPIYHSKREKVEDAISSSSFRNLLQVIRSLCDQDERLQVEINNLAYSKEKRKSSKVNIVLPGFSEEQDTVLLEGFEEELKNSLFDQVVERISNNWDLWLLQLKEYLKINKDYPSTKDNIELYRWVTQQRNRKKKGVLENEEIRKLNEIEFVWDYQEWKWDSMYSELKEYARHNEFEPHKEDYPEIAKWYVSQKSQLKNDRLSPHRKNLILGIQFKGTYKDRKWYDKFAEYKLFSEENDFEPDIENNPELAKWMLSQKSQINGNTLDQDKMKLFNSIVFKSSFNKRWEDSYNDLVVYRKINPNNWPPYDRKNLNSEMNKLYIFCQSIRKRYRENSLDDYWFEKMAAIDFNFDGQTDNWTKYFEEIKCLLKDRKTINQSEIGNNAYSWIVRHKKKLEKGSLSPYQSRKIKELHLDQFFEAWEDIYEKVEDWVSKHGKTPTKGENADLNIWLYSQRSRYKNGTLPDEQLAKLEAVGFDLEGLGKERNEKKWLQHFHKLKNVLEKHNRFPTPTFEKELYVWVQSQRAAMAGTLKRRKPLSKKRISLLNSINFPWVGEGRANQSWEDSFEEFKKFITPNGRLIIPSTINGERSIMYNWWSNQKLAYKKGDLPEERIKAFREIGIDFSTIKKYSKKDGFTKWANRLHEIAEFININGCYPSPSSSNKRQRNLYQSLARTKRAFHENELHEEQIDLLKELNINLS